MCVYVYGPKLIHHANAVRLEVELGAQVVDHERGRLANNGGLLYHVCMYICMSEKYVCINDQAARCCIMYACMYVCMQYSIMYVCMQ